MMHMSHVVLCSWDWDSWSTELERNKYNLLLLLLLLPLLLRSQPALANWCPADEASRIELQNAARVTARCIFSGVTVRAGVIADNR